MSRYYDTYTKMKSPLISYLFNNLKMSKIGTQNGIKLWNPPMKSLKRNQNPSTKMS